MHDRKADSHADKLALVGVFLSIGVGLVVGYVSAIYHDQQLLLGLTLGTAATIVGLVFLEIFNSRRVWRTQEERIVSEIQGIRSFVAAMEKDQITAFVNNVDGLEYSIALVNNPLCMEVKNTVLRFGSERTADHFGEEQYAKWISAKRDSLIRRSCPWSEVISTHIANNRQDPQMLFVAEMLEEFKLHPTYRVSYIDETAQPMLQLCLFRFKDRSSEVVFGHQFANMPRGQAFATRLPALVDYFDKYFDHFFDNAHSVASATNSLSTFGNEQEPNLRLKSERAPQASF